MEPSWTCSQCGHAENLQTFCTHCGSARPVAEPAATPTVGPWLSSPPQVAPAAQPLAEPLLAAPLAAPVAPQVAPQVAPHVSPQVSPSTGPQASTRSEVPEIAVLPGETVLVDERFTPHLILKHLTSRIVLTDRRVVVQHPHALFGLIPMGYSLQSAPLHEINQVHFGHLVRNRHVAFGVGAVLWGLLVLGALQAPWFALLGLILIGAGVGLIVTARVVGISADTGGHLRLHASGRGGDVVRASQVGNRIVTQLDLVRSRP